VGSASGCRAEAAPAVRCQPLTGLYCCIEVCRDEPHTDTGLLLPACFASSTSAPTTAEATMSLLCRDHLNVVFIGHVDAGKSTIGGQILYLTGGVDERTIQKYERCAGRTESSFLIRN